MATMFVGSLPPKNNLGTALGAGMSEGLVKGYEDQQKQEDLVFAITMKMYQDATPEDRKLLESSPGWGKVLSMAQKRGVPLVQTPTGGQGFAAPAPSLERQTAEEARRFPGQEGAPGQTPLPAGAAGYSARQEALKAAVTGDLALKRAHTGYYEKETNLADARLDLQRFEAKTKDDVARGTLTEEQARTKIQQFEAETRATAASSEGLYRMGSLKVAQGNLAEEIRKNTMHYGLLAEQLTAKTKEDAHQNLGQYDNFNKRFSQYKTDLRQPLKMAERDQTVRQAFGDYMSYKQTVDPKNPIQVSGLQGATSEMMSLLVDEVVRGVEPGSKADEIRITNYLDTITAAAAQGLIEPTILHNIKLVLKTAGYSQDVKSGAWKMPTSGGGGFFGYGGTP